MPHPTEWLTTITDDITLRLAHYMEATNRSRVEIAQALEVTPQAVSNWLSGRANPGDLSRLRITAMLSLAKESAISRRITLAAMDE